MFVAGVLAGEHGDFVREAVALVARELMEAEISSEVGAQLGEAGLMHRVGDHQCLGHDPAVVADLDVLGV